jgi:hypothetical protein
MRKFPLTGSLSSLQLLGKVLSVDVISPFHSLTVLSENNVNVANSHNRDRIGCEPVFACNGCFLP